MNMKYHIEIDIDDEKNTTEVKQAVDPWVDLALIAEGLATIIPLASTYKEMTFEETLQYAKDYLDKAAKTYKMHQEMRPEEDGSAGLK